MEREMQAITNADVGFKPKMPAQVQSDAYSSPNMAIFCRTQTSRKQSLEPSQQNPETSFPAQVVLNVIPRKTGKRYPVGAGQSAGELHQSDACDQLAH